MNSLHYFGTDTCSAGHYFWDFDATGQRLIKSDLGFYNLPFDPEKMPYSEQYKGERRKGFVKFYLLESSYIVCAIYGSPIDNRGGCKSVFFVKNDGKGIEWTKKMLLHKIKTTPAAMKIINQMPFPVDYFTFQDINPVG